MAVGGLYSSRTADGEVVSFAKKTGQKAPKNKGREKWGRTIKKKKRKKRKKKKENITYCRREDNKGKKEGYAPQNVKKGEGMRKTQARGVKGRKQRLKKRKRGSAARQRSAICTTAQSGRNRNGACEVASHAQVGTTRGPADE